MNELFPIYVKLDQIQTLVVGAGPVGLEKLEALIGNSPKANIHVVAKEIIPEFERFIADKTNVRLSQRAFELRDMERVDLIILATNNPEFNNQVRELASQNHILLNVADKPSLCDFYLGSVVQKGNLKIGISTNGKSPTIAKRLKEFLNDLLPEEIDQTLDLMQTMRNSLKGDFQEKIKVLNAHTKDLLTNTSNDSAN
ncbi:bifunctional precorrin-2 dehydrogenase/sirohydrochlorin ferrochelatase [Sphingobacterium olei]|uniref:precorrin-2 dehydrogenase n=1 Tax=Sphingobacterium olei TaxID=2571155 RepID=A0A4V6WHY4_9SPHI|nr:bifunctional precorrin-2 dehydrogenase/sirohydrochlorin ferrochelatase [Sphingobacterium olei]TJZ63468.1 bifunctional precorrin-2 dehydrogenase/sirohydrochlorin ferrochelatase [Sphingobacterium olei]